MKGSLYSRDEAMKMASGGPGGEEDDEDEDDEDDDSSASGTIGQVTGFTNVRLLLPSSGCTWTWVLMAWPCAECSWG